MEDNYIPYGPEWEKEVKKLPKQFLLLMLKKAYTRLQAAEKFIEESPSTIMTADSQQRAYAEWMASKT